MTILPSLLVGRALATADEIKLSLPPSITLTGEDGFNKFFNEISGLVFAFLGVAAFAGIVYSGVMMITAGGDTAKFAAGRKNLIWSIIGIIIVTLAFFIIRFVYMLTGAIKATP